MIRTCRVDSEPRVLLLARMERISTLSLCVLATAKFSENGPVLQMHYRGLQWKCWLQASRRKTKVTTPTNCFNFQRINFITSGPETEAYDIGIVDG